MAQEIITVLLRLLANREHSQLELKRKLQQKGFAAVAIEAALLQFSAKHLQSDDRFIEAYIHARRQRGYGPVRIGHELRERGITAAAINQYLKGSDPLWLQRARYAREKKFGAALPTGFSERIRQQRFLEYRGFTPEQVNRIFETADDIA